MLSVKDVSYAYNQRPVLENIQLHIEEGETVAILGPSGVGKSTLFNLISGNLSLQSGEILLDGSPDIRGQISYMLQKDMLYQHYTVIENIMLPLLIDGKSKDEAKNYAQSLLEQFDLQGWQDYYPHALSGGMRQRVALMRTAAFGRTWVLLDEAFSALDAITRSALHDWFIDYRARMGWSTLLITHDVDEALLLAHRIYILKGKPGTIFEEIGGLTDQASTENIIFQPEFLQAKQKILTSLVDQ